jgi:hypothetical protein
LHEFLTALAVIEDPVEEPAPSNLSGLLDDAEDNPDEVSKYAWVALKALTVI